MCQHRFHTSSQPAQAIWPTSIRHLSESVGSMSSGCRFKRFCYLGWYTHNLLDGKSVGGSCIPNPILNTNLAKSHLLITPIFLCHVALKVYIMHVLCAHALCKISKLLRNIRQWQAIFREIWVLQGYHILQQPSVFCVAEPDGGSSISCRCYLPVQWQSCE